MDIQLQKVQQEEEHVLHNLMQFYIYEFSQYMSSIKVNKKGCFDPFNLDIYWNDENHHAYFIKVDGELAGFVLVRSEYGENPNTIKEFFVMKSYEGNGVGKAAASTIFKTFPGEWLVTQSEKNQRAKHFWRNVISKHTGGVYNEYLDEKNRTCQEFHLL